MHIMHKLCKLATLLARVVLRDSQWDPFSTHGKKRLMTLQRLPNSTSDEIRPNGTEKTSQSVSLVRKWFYTGGESGHKEIIKFLWFIYWYFDRNVRALVVQWLERHLYTVEVARSNRVRSIFFNWPRVGPLLFAISNHELLKMIK